MSINGRAGGIPETIVARHGKSHNYRENNWRAGGLAGCRYKCFMNLMSRARHGHRGRCPSMIVAGSCESYKRRGDNWRAGGLAGRRYKYFDDIDVAGCG